MKELAADLWAVEADARCITTNGSIFSHPNTGAPVNPMGGGCAREAAERHPQLPFLHGLFIREQGVNVHIMPWDLIMFPTKWTIRDRADTDLIQRSARQLLDVMDLWGLKSVALPRPGSGLGGLKWADVKPVIENILDDRITVVRYPGEAL